MTFSGQIWTGFDFYPRTSVFPSSNFPLVLRTHLYLTQKDKCVKPEFLEIFRISGANWTGMYFPISVLPFGGLVVVIKSQREHSVS
jgi:hypothetical protein